jgi:hypothetical protein
MLQVQLQYESLGFALRELAALHFECANYPLPYGRERSQIIRDTFDATDDLTKARLALEAAKLAEYD